MSSFTALSMPQRPAKTSAAMLAVPPQEISAEERAFQDSDVLLLQQQEPPTQPPSLASAPAQTQTMAEPASVPSATQTNSMASIPDHILPRPLPYVPSPSTNPLGNNAHTKHLTHQDRTRVRVLYYDAGRSVTEIAHITGFSKGQVRRGIENATPGKRPGRPRRDGLNVVGHDAYVPGGFDEYIKQKGVRNRRHRHHRPPAASTRKIMGDDGLPIGGRVGTSVESDFPGSIAALWARQNDGASKVVTGWPEVALGPAVDGNEGLRDGEKHVESDEEEMLSAQEEESSGEDDGDNEDGDNGEQDDEDHWEDGEYDEHADSGSERGVNGGITESNGSLYLQAGLTKRQGTSRVPDYPPPPRGSIDATKTIVLVTDATSGIGHAIASALLRAYCKSTEDRPPSGGPYHVFLAAANYKRARQTVDTLLKHHGNTVTPIQLDTGDSWSVTNAARMIHGLVGRVDVMVLSNCLSGMEEPQLSGSPVEIQPPLGPARKLDAVSVFRQTFEKTVMTSYALSEGLKWLLMAQPSPPTQPKVKRLIHVTSPLCSITGRQIATHQGGTMAGVAGSGGGLGGIIPGGPGRPLDGTQHHSFTDPTTNPAKIVCVPVPALAEYRMALAALNMLVACQASAAHAAGVRVGVWNSGLLPTPPLPPRDHFSGSLARSREKGEGVETCANRRARMKSWKKMHGGGPGVSDDTVEEAGKAFVKVVNGERDGDFGGLMDTFGGWLDW